MSWFLVTFVGNSCVACDADLICNNDVSFSFEKCLSGFVAVVCIVIFDLVLASLLVVSMNWNGVIGVIFTTNGVILSFCLLRMLL